jgi:D-sedoheptulose 7-phosphate isomerase
MDDYIMRYLDEVQQVARRIGPDEVQKMVDLLVEIRDGGGLLFLLGVGGGAGNATHAVNDFRKIAGIESYTPIDNISELTARVNDEGWSTAYVNWLKTSRLSRKDGVFVFSVGGGNEHKSISTNIVEALKHAKTVGAKVLGVVGRDGGYTAEVADACVMIPVISPDTVTAHTESFQAVVWHLVVSHPKMKVAEMKWESVK